MKKAIRKAGLKPVPNANQWLRKWTTWLQAVQLGLLAVIGLHFTLPARWQELIPDWLAISVVVAAAVTTFLTVVAANVTQTKLKVRLRYEPLTQLPPEES